MFTKISLAVPTYFVGSTKPGSPPELAPREFDSLPEAKAFLVSEIDRHFEIMTPEEQSKLGTKADLLQDFIESKPKECNVPFDDYVFWITKE